MEPLYTVDIYAGGLHIDDRECMYMYMYVPSLIIVSKGTETFMGSLHSGKPNSASICICLSGKILDTRTCIERVYDRVCVHVGVCLCVLHIRA